jgi:hypothetical protein
MLNVFERIESVSVARELRPTRIAFLVDPNDPHRVRQAVSMASALWGGALCPIVPVMRRRPSRWVPSPAAIFPVGGTSLRATSPRTTPTGSCRSSTWRCATSAIGGEQRSCDRDNRDALARTTNVRRARPGWPGRARDVVYGTTRTRSQPKNLKRAPPGAT